MGAEQSRPGQEPPSASATTQGIVTVGSGQKNLADSSSFSASMAPLVQKMRDTEQIRPLKANDDEDFSHWPEIFAGKRDSGDKKKTSVAHMPAADVVEAYTSYWSYVQEITSTCCKHQSEILEQVGGVERQFTHTCELYDKRFGFVKKSLSDVVLVNKLSNDIDVIGGLVGDLIEHIVDLEAQMRGSPSAVRTPLLHHPDAAPTLSLDRYPMIKEWMAFSALAKARAAAGPPTDILPLPRDHAVG